jgi:putative NIF3 family GTP cyclohydrolase 1 type 2
MKDVKVRTGFLLILLSGTASVLAAQQNGALTAAQVIERIQAKVGVPWRTETVDTIKAGDPKTVVTGIATTMMATYDVLVRAAAEGKNLVITHEPTFYSHLDKTDLFANENDPVWAEKERFIKEHNMVVFRFHDHWHMHRPDGIMTGVVRSLQWQKFQNATSPSQFTVPEMTVDQLAQQMKQRLGIQVVRVVGSAQMKITKVALAPGAGGPLGHRRALQSDNVEVLAIGEVPEWETIEYVTDAVSQGRKKALILLGHIPSEQPGMEDCAEWLKGFVKEVPVGFVPTKEPFWLAK